MIWWSGCCSLLHWLFRIVIGQYFPIFFKEEIKKDTISITMYLEHKVCKNNARMIFGSLLTAFEVCKNVFLHQTLSCELSSNRFFTFPCVWMWNDHFYHQQGCNFQNDFPPTPFQFYANNEIAPQFFEDKFSLNAQIEQDFSTRDLTWCHKYMVLKSLFEYERSWWCFGGSW